MRNAEDLFHYVEDLIEHGLSGREAVAVNLACQVALVGKLSIALKADHQLDAMKLGCESRRASRQMGRQIAKIGADKVTKHAGVLNSYQIEIEQNRTPGHAAVALGLTLGTTGWTQEAAIAAFLYQTAVGFVSAAMKLLPLGQREGQRLLERWMPLIGQISHEAAGKKDMASWTPVQDIYGMRHSQLEWRLFRS